MAYTITSAAATEIARAAREFASGPCGINHGAFFDRCGDLLADRGLIIPATEQAWDGSDFWSLKAMARRLRHSVRAA